MLEESQLQQRSFDASPIHSPKMETQNSIQHISLEEKKAIVTLTLLYFIQGIPLGFWGAAIGILLVEAGASFEDLAVLSTVVLPFSFKMVTAPLLDTFYIASIGKRRTYILPIQYLMGILFVIMSVCDIDLWISEKRIWFCTLIGTFMIFLAAQQDIAVDGWVLTSLSDKFVHLGASAQSIGQILGNIYASSILISLNSAVFCNKFIYSEPQAQGLLSLQGFCLITGLIILTITLYVNFFTQEKPEQYNIRSTMKPTAQVIHSVQSMFSMMKNKNVLTLVLYLCTFRYGTQPMQSTFGTILQKSGFPKELLSTISTLFVPVAIIIPLIVGAKIKQGEEFTWLFKLYQVKVLDVALQYIIILTFDYLGGFNILTATICVFNLSRYKIFSMFFNFVLINFTFVIHSGFFNRVSDSDVGGTYLTFLNSSHNLGTSIASSFSLYLIGIMGFDFVIILSLVYSLVYYLFCKDQITELQIIKRSEWKVKNGI